MGRQLSAAGQTGNVSHRGGGHADKVQHQSHPESHCHGHWRSSALGPGTPLWASIFSRSPPRGPSPPSPPHQPSSCLPSLPSANSYTRTRHPGHPWVLPRVWWLSTQSWTPSSRIPPQGFVFPLLLLPSLSLTSRDLGIPAALQPHNHAGTGSGIQAGFYSPIASSQEHKQGQDGTGSRGRLQQ